MNIEIRKLTPDLAEDYAHFFDVTPHDVNIDEKKCYCVTWRNDDSYIGNGDHWYSTREERRSRAIQFVKDGSIQGYLAYHNDEIVGWCNANANCQGGISHLRSYWEIEEYCEDIKIKSIFCFAIAPKVQRMGVATKLLEQVCHDAANEGFDFIEAYANKEYIAPDCRGHLTMYEKCGFVICTERDGKIVVRKPLKLP
jgi:GNAT superfamily N-acetyltransferase